MALHQHQLAFIFGLLGSCIIYYTFFPISIHLALCFHHTIITLSLFVPLLYVIVRYIPHHLIHISHIRIFLFNSNLIFAWHRFLFSPIILLFYIKFHINLLLKHAFFYMCIIFNRKFCGSTKTCYPGVTLE